MNFLRKYVQKVGFTQTQKPDPNRRYFPKPDKTQTVIRLKTLKSKIATFFPF